MGVPHVRQSLMISWDQISVQIIALSKKETCFEGCRSSGNGFPRRSSAGSTMNRRAFGQYHFTFELLIFNRDAIRGLVGEVLVTVGLYLSEVVAIQDLEILTRHPTKCARTTRLEAYVKVAPVSGSTYFLWDFSATNASSNLQSLPCSKRSAGSASQNFRITAYSVSAIAFSPIRHSDIPRPGELHLRLEDAFCCLPLPCVCTGRYWWLAQLYSKELRLILSN